MSSTKMADKKPPLTYASTGISYEKMDPLKRLAQIEAQKTAHNLGQYGVEVSESRGESAFVWEEEDSYRAFAIEGLGTKNLVADKMYELTGKSYYGSIAQDIVAAIVNDIVVVGAKPLVVNAYFGLGSSNFLEREDRVKDLVEGFAKACNLAGVTWGGGETPTHKDIINPKTLDLGGSCIGIIKPKERLTLGEKLSAGDVILFIGSNGIHANGLTLARKIAEEIPEGYLTKLSDGTTFGEALLKPSHIYAKVVQDLFEAKVNIHYMVNITGHGFRKLMRAKNDFDYQVDVVPPLEPLFEFIKEQSGNSDEEMYGTFNMGAGFAIYLPFSELEKAEEIIQRNNLKSFRAGTVEKGLKQVMIRPKNIVFKAETLGVR